MQIGHGGAAGPHDGVRRTARDDHDPEVGHPSPQGRLGQPALDVQPVGRERVDDRRHLALRRAAPHPQRVEEPSLLVPLDGGRRPHPAAARRLQGQYPGGGGSVRGLQEDARHTVPGHQVTHIRPAAHGRCHRPGRRRSRHGYPGSLHHAVAEALVEHDRDVLGVVQQNSARRCRRAGHVPNGGGEPGVPAGRPLHPRRVVDPAQQPLDLGVLTGRVDAHGLAGKEDRVLAQHLQPGHGARPGQSGSTNGVVEEADPAVAGIADDREARRRAIH